MHACILGPRLRISAVEQWFSTFLGERNPNETFQRLEEPLYIYFIVLCKKHYLPQIAPQKIAPPKRLKTTDPINKMRLAYSCSDFFKIKIQTVKKYIYFHNPVLNFKLAEPLDCTGGTLGFRGTPVENQLYD